MAGKAGFYSRPFRRVHVLRGFDGCEPKTFTKKAEITSANSATGADPIISGDVVSIDTGTGKWLKGAQDGQLAFIALSDSFDTDVVASGFLPALSCAGKFEIETARFDTALTYVEDVDGLRGGKAGGSTPGIITKAAASADVADKILGLVSRAELVLNATADYNAVSVAPANYTVGAKRNVYPQNADELGSVSVLTFITQFQL